MNTQQSEKNELAGTTHWRRLPVLAILVALDGFVFGGLVALLLVNRLLANHLARYVQGNLMAAGSTVLDLMDNLLIYLMSTISALLVLLSITAVAWVWSRTESRLLRYGVVLLLVTIVLVVGLAWGVGRVTTPPPPPPMTPTPIAMVGEAATMNLLFHAIPHVWRPV